MAEVVEPIAKTIAEFRPYKQAIGKAALFLLGLGITDALMGGLEKLKVPKIATGPAVAFGVTIPPVSAALGPTLTEVLNICGYVAPIDELLKLRERVADLIGKIFKSSPSQIKGGGGRLPSKEELVREVERLLRERSLTQKGSSPQSSQTSSSFQSTRTAFEFKIK